MKCVVIHRGYLVKRGTLQECKQYKNTMQRVTDSHHLIMTTRAWRGEDPMGQQLSLDLGITGN